MNRSYSDAMTRLFSRTTPPREPLPLSVVKGAARRAAKVRVKEHDADNLLNTLREAAWERAREHCE